MMRLKSFLAFFVLFFVCATIFPHLPWTVRIDALWSDGLQKLQKPRPWPQEAVLVLIDEQALHAMGERYGQRWPWNRDAFAGLFAAIYKAGAKKIVADLLFLEPSEDAYSDELLGSYAAACNVILARKDRSLPIIWPQNEYKAQLKNNLGDVGYQPDSDGVIRSYHVQGSLARITVRSGKFPDQIRLRWYGGLEDMPANLKFSAAPLVLEGYGPNGILHEIKKSGIDELNSNQVAAALEKVQGESFHNALKDKVVFIGANAAAITDIKAMPLGAREPGVLVHYTAWLNMVRGEYLRQCQTWFGVDKVAWGMWLLIGIYFAAVWLGWIEWNGAWMGLIAGIMLPLVVSVFLFSKNIFIPVGSVLQGVFLSFVAGISRQWLLEQKKKREIQSLFSNYVAPEVLSELMKNPSSLQLGGKSCETTIFFSDLEGFTDVSEKCKPEELIKIINDYLSEMSPWIVNHGGYLDKYIGDAIMGVFGAPQPLPNHALAACKAALDCQRHLRLIGQHFKDRYNVQLKARIGIHSGQVIVGNVGSQRKKNYTALGDVVNLASRLESANKEFHTSILIGDATRDAAGEAIIARPVELLRVKGKELSVQTYELIGLKGNVDKLIIEFIAIYQDAYHLYRDRMFKESLEKFSQALRVVPNDFLCQLYQKRCEKFIQEPPPKDWDGVYTLKTK